MNQFIPQSRPARGEGTNPYSDAGSGFEHAPQLDRAELTPEEQAERADFQRSVNLLNVIGENSDFKSVGVFAGVTGEKQLKDTAGTYSMRVKHNPEDLPVDSMFYVDIDNPKFHTLQVFLADLRFHAGRSDDKTRETSAHQPIEVMLRGGDAELTFKITSKQNFIIRDREKLGTPPKDVVDHTERMAKLAELYDIVSDVYATQDGKTSEPTSTDDASDDEVVNE